MKKRLNFSLLAGFLIFLVSSSSSNAQIVGTLCKDILGSLGYVFIRDEISHYKRIGKGHPDKIGSILRIHSDVLSSKDYEYEKKRTLGETIYLKPRDYLMTQEVEISDNQGTYKCFTANEVLKCGDYILNQSSKNRIINFPSKWGDDHNQSFGLSGIVKIIKNNTLYTPLPVNNGMVLPARFHSKKKEFQPKLEHTFPTKLGRDCLSANAGLKGTYPVLYEYGGWCRKTEVCSIDKGSITSFSFNTLLIHSKYYDFFDYLRTSSRGGDPLTGIKYDCFDEEIDSELKKVCKKQSDQLSKLLNSEDNIPVTIKITISAPVTQDAFADL